MQRTLYFYGTSGEREATLEIDRTGPIDLTPLFVDVFKQYAENIAWKQCLKEKKRKASEYEKWYEREAECKYTLNDKKASFKFSIDELFSTMLYRYEPEDLSRFLKENVTDIEDFGNNVLLRKIDTFKENYERIHFRWVASSYFVVEPMDGSINPSEIEEIVRPRTKRLSQDAIYNYRDINKDKKNENRITTRPYYTHSQYIVERILLRELSKKVEPKKILMVYRLHTPSLDYFSIINQYRLPTAHLEIVPKNCTVYDQQVQNQAKLL